MPEIQAKEEQLDERRKAKGERRNFSLIPSPLSLPLVTRLTEVNLIKRMVMKRCGDAVDLNPMAVELAKLSLWLDSFTLGAPLSFLDHHLKCGNSLIGKDDISTAIVPGSQTAQQFQVALRSAGMISRMSDSTAAEVSESRSLYHTMQQTLAPFKRRFDYLLAREFTKMRSNVSPERIEAAIQSGKLDGISADGQADIQLADETAAKHRFFHWRLEFPEVWYDENGEKQNPGFDADVGNPPYGAKFDMTLVPYLRDKFRTFVWRGESYLMFAESAILLLRPGGFFSYIVPDTYLNLGFTQSLRTFLLQNTKLREVVALPSVVFPDASVDTTILVAEKAPPSSSFHRSQVSVRTFEKKSTIVDVNQPSRQFSVSTEVWFKQNAFNVQSDTRETGIMTKIQASCQPLSTYAEMFYGIKGYQVGKGKPPQTRAILESKPFTSATKADRTYEPFFDGRDIARYELLWRENNWIKYGPWLAEPRQPQKYEGEKLLIRKIVGETLIATYHPVTSYCNTLLFVLKVKDQTSVEYRYLLGLLNSRFIGWYFRKKFQISSEDTFPQIMIRDILQFPIPDASAKNQVPMVALVEKMLKLHKDLAKAKSQAKKDAIQSEVKTTDQDIDALVYELYGLTEEELDIVEEGEER